MRLNYRIYLKGNNIVKNKIKEYREQIGMSRKELSEKSGISVNYLAVIEEQHPNMKINTFGNIADALGVNVQNWGKLIDND